MDTQNEQRQKAVTARVQSLMNGAIGVLWILPIVLFWIAEFRYGRSLYLIICLFFQSLCLTAFFLPDGYFQPKPFEISGRFYERLGVHFYKRFMANGDYMNQYIRRFEPDYRVIRNRDSLKGYELQTRASERGHILWLIATIPPTVYAAIMGWHTLFAYLFLSNVIVNLYPIMLQRYTRCRIHRNSWRVK